MSNITFQRPVEDYQNFIKVNIAPQTNALSATFKTAHDEVFTVPLSEVVKAHKESRNKEIKGVNYPLEEAMVVAHEKSKGLDNAVADGKRNWDSSVKHVKKVNGALFAAKL